MEAILGLGKGSKETMSAHLATEITTEVLKIWWIRSWLQIFRLTNYSDIIAEYFQTQCLMASASSVPLATFAISGQVADQVRLKLLPEYDGNSLPMWKILSILSLTFFSRTHLH